jgi:hypothetical protein
MQKARRECKDGFLPHPASYTVVRSWRVPRVFMGAMSM